MTLKTTVKWDGLARPVQFGTIDIPERFSLVATPTDDDQQPGLVIEVEVVDGIPRVGEVRITATDHGRGVIRSDLVMPLEDHLEFASKWVAALHDIKNHGAAEINLDDLDSTFIKDFRRARRTDLRRGPTDDDLRLVGEIYDTAESAPVQAVRQHFDLATRTAYLWVKRAREKGFLK